MSRKWLGPTVPKFDCFVLFLCENIYPAPLWGSVYRQQTLYASHTSWMFFFIFLLQNMGYSCAKCAILFVHVGVIMSKIYGLQLVHFFHAQRAPRGHLNLKCIGSSNLDGWSHSRRFSEKALRSVLQALLT